MKAIKKVAVTPVAENTGTIIDSFNTTDDKHTNAPSINAVETELDKKVSNLNDNQTTLSFTSDGTATIIRKGNTVTITATATIDADAYTASNNYIVLPNWAIPSLASDFSSGVETDMNLYTRHKLVYINLTNRLQFYITNTNTSTSVSVSHVMSYVVD